MARPLSIKTGALNKGALSSGKPIRHACNGMTKRVGCDSITGLTGSRKTGRGRLFQSGWAMGGNALNVSTSRCAADRFTAIQARVQHALATRLGVRVETIPYYRSKPDFGDLDLLVSSDCLPDENKWTVLSDFAQEHCHARQVVRQKNSDVMSFDYRDSPDDPTGFQVDLILTPDAWMETSRNYFAYNDLGNLIGRAAHTLGFAWGHRGLLYPVRDGDYLVAKLQVTSDTAEGLAFLGYDPDRFARGFDTLNEMFEYTTTSPWFCRKAFALERRNNRSRARDRKRPTYRAFLEFLEAHPHIPDGAGPFEREQSLARAYARFPAFAAAYDQAQSNHALTIKVRQVFNGERVGEWTGLTGKPLGAVMSAVRSGLSPETILAMALDDGPQGLRAHVENAHHAMREAGCRRPPAP